MEAKATARTVLVVPRKTRLVTRLIQGKSVEDATNMFKASVAFLPLIMSDTNLALIGDTLKPLAIAFASIFSPPSPYYFSSLAVPCPPNLRVNANSPNLCPTISSVT